MINKKLPVVSLIFYILAGLFLIFAVWAAVYSFRYIADLVAMGQVVVSDSLFEVISFHMSNFGQYVVFTALLFGAGWIVHLFAGVEVETYDFADEELESMEELLDDLETELDEE
jgi:hypothetical protein